MTIGTSENPLDILLVEDNPGDARLTEERIKDSGFVANVTVVEDGEAAVSYLRNEGEYVEASRPNLVLLDLRLPKKDGLEVLADINSDQSLSGIPVVILTGTQAEASILDSYDIPSNRFFKKPIDPDRLTTLVRIMRTAGQLGPIGPKPEPVSSQAEPSKRGKKWWWPFG